MYPPPDDFISEDIPGAVQLHDYQKAGVEFLVNREHALLADDMGLGKTAQCAVAMAVLLRSERIGRALVICPRAVIRQWQNEAKRWAGIRANVVDGPPAIRARVWESAPGVLLATPHIVLNDSDLIQRSHFDLVVCDDVTTLKSPGKITTAIRNIPRVRSWCLSGTPMENKPEDFTNVMEFVYPRLFSPTELLTAPSKGKLQERVKPYVLRRRKSDHLDLPPKQFVGPIELDLEGEQLAAYRRAERQQWEALQASDGQVTRVHIFRVIGELIRLCNFEPYSKQSAKLEAVDGALEEALGSWPNGAKAVVFSQWVETLRFLEEALQRFQPLVYHGSLNQLSRDRTLEEFNAKGRLLLMSTKAGSRGLNLQKASYVFHFDRSWNPVPEMQAEDRCWRMGQERTVFVYRYTAKGTIEERIHEVLCWKQGLFDQYVNSLADDTDDLASSRWSIDELVDLLRPSQ